MKYGLVALLLVTALAIGVSEFALPQYYENQVEEGFKKQVEKVEVIKVDISTHPALLLLSGRVQNGSIYAKGIQLEGLRIEEVQARYTDLVTAKTEKGVQVVSGDNTFFQAVFLEEDLTRYLNSRFAGFDKLSLDLRPNQAALNLRVLLFNTPFDLQLKGNFQMPNNHTIRFVPQGLDVGKVSLPSNLVSKIVKEIEFDLELEEYPLPLNIDEIRIEEGRLVVVGGE